MKAPATAEQIISPGFAFASASHNISTEGAVQWSRGGKYYTGSYLEKKENYLLVFLSETF
mgnify:CR=1 FL=1